MHRTRDPLPWLLILQAVLLFWRLDHLSPWMDEVWTLQTIEDSWTGVARRAAADVHPPLYFLLAKLWSMLPLPADPAVRVRALSGLAALATTVLLDRLWLRDLPPARRVLALAILTTSPCVMLYGRMARSYTLQAALATAAIWAAWRLVEQRRWRDTATAGALSAALLYTHYVPGIAVFVATAVWAAARAGAARAIAYAGVVALLFAPWIPAFVETVSRVRPENNAGARYLFTGNPAAEQLLRLAYTGVSFTIGEAFPWWALMVTVGIGVLCLLQVRQIRWRGLAGLIALAAVGGYIGIGRWVSFPFVAARLLWIVPLLILGVVHLERRRWFWLLPVAAMASHLAYFSREGFLNSGYAVPLDQIAASIRAASRPENAVVLSDPYNSDGPGLAYQFGPAWRTFPLVPEPSASDVAGKQLWIVRNTHDISPGGVVAAAEKRLCPSPISSWTWVRIPVWQHVVLRSRPEYFYRVVACSSP